MNAIKRKVLIGMLACVSCCSVFGCEKITDPSAGSIVFSEDDKTGNKAFPTSCGIYEVSDAEIDFEQIFLDFIKEDKNYLVSDYREETVQYYNKTGKKLKQNLPDTYKYCYVSADKDATQKEDDFAEGKEELVLYDENELQGMYIGQSGYPYSLLTDIDLQMLRSGENHQKQLSFATIDDTKKQIQTILTQYGIDGSVQIEIYGLQAKALSSMLKESYPEWTPQSPIKDAYYVEVFISKDDLPLLDNINLCMRTDESYRSIPCIYFFINEDGIQGFRIENYQKIGKKLSDEKIISLEEARETVQKMYAGATDNEDYIYKSGRLMYVIERDGKKNVLKPIWYFEIINPLSKEISGPQDKSIMIDASTGKKID